MTSPLVTALAAMTVACPDPTHFAEFLVDVWDWEILVKSPLSADVERLWGIDAGTAGTEFFIVRSAGANRGMVRIVAGEERSRTHPRAARWGGFEIVVADGIEGIHEAMTAHPDAAPFGPVFEYDFTKEDSNIHQAFSSRLPGGTHVTLTMAVTQPKYRPFHSANARVGHIFEVPVTTPDYRRCRAFYENTLGMTPTLESSSTDGPMHRAWGVPAGSMYWLDILKGDAPDEGLGSVEIHGCGGEFIDPDPARLRRFDGGACLATLTAADIDAVHRVVQDCAEATVLSDPRSVAAAPYNGSRAFCFSGPDGERIEICEAIWG